MSLTTVLILFVSLVAFTLCMGGAQYLLDRDHWIALPLGVLVMLSAVAGLLLALFCGVALFYDLLIVLELIS